MNSAQSIEVKSRGGRPRDATKRDAILDAGWSTFMDHGVEGATMEGIAAAAAVAKVTLYSHFPDKLALFEAVVRRKVDTLTAEQRGVPRGGPLRDRLIAFGTNLMRFVQSDDIVRFDAMLRAEIVRAPSLAQLFWAAGPAHALHDLRQLLADAEAAGELAFDDAETAAEDLAGLWMGMAEKRRALGADRRAPDARVERGVDLFLRLYQVA